MNGIFLAASDSQIYSNTHAPLDAESRRLVLVADANEEYRGEMKEILDLYDIGILEARDGEEAIDLIVSEKPDLSLINAELPLLDGYEVTRLIRNIQSFERMPIVLVSVQTERLFRKRAFDVGGDGFHVAPLDFERLDYILENHLFRIDKIG